MCHDFLTKVICFSPTDPFEQKQRMNCFYKELPSKTIIATFLLLNRLKATNITL